jgi:integrase/recombinase XerC
VGITSLELSQATEAQRVARLQGLDAEALRRHAQAAAAARDEEALWELMLAHLSLPSAREEPLSRHTLRAYRRGLKELLALWPDEDLLAPGPGVGHEYARRLLEGDREPLAQGEPRGRRGRRVKRGPLSPATVALRLAAGRALYDALIWAGAAAVDPFRDVGRRDLSTERGAANEARAYTDMEVNELLAAARDAHERVLVLLGAHAGLRVSEMVALRWEDVDLRTGVLRVGAGDDEARDEVVVSPRLAAELGDLAREIEGDSVARHRPEVLELRSQFGVYNRLRRLCRRAHVEFKGVAALRHAAGARLYRQTHDLALVQEHLRHKASDMARRYAKVDKGRLRGSLSEWD